MREERANTDTDGTIIGLDVGGRRIGVAAAGRARIASPLRTILHDENVFDTLAQLLVDQHAAAVVVGLPRGLDGQETAQTLATRVFADDLQKRCKLPLFWQDEAVTSRQAEAELRARGKPYAKGDIDALAATYILEDFLHEHSAKQLAEEVKI